MKAKISLMQNKKVIGVLYVTFTHLKVFQELLLTWKRDTGLFLGVGKAGITHIWSQATGDTRGCEVPQAYLPMQELNDPTRVHWKTQLVMDESLVKSPTKVPAGKKKVARSA